MDTENPNEIISPSEYSSPFSRFMEKHARVIVVFFVCIIFLFSIFYFAFFSAPSNFPNGTVITISPGENLSEVVHDLREQHAIKSSVIFQCVVIVFGGEKRVIAGDYLLAHPQNAVTLAWRVVRGSFGMTEIKITIPEGFSVAQIGDVLQKKLTGFDEATFLTQAKGQEGYLFPDTYFFPGAATSSQIILQMENNFNAHIKPVDSAIDASGHSEYDILKMASILEAEATSTQDREIVAGILWTRLKNGMPLQVDSTLRYVTGKTSAQLTQADLKLQSSYNTYINTGLPPTPIDNPGLDAINATLNPILTSYVYFLTGDDGAMHYAVTFAEQLKNQQIYLK